MKIIKSLLILSICILNSITIKILKRHLHNEEEVEANYEPNSPRHKKHKNVYIINKHYHINQPSEIMSSPIINSMPTSGQLINHDIPSTHYIPKVNWVDDNIRPITTMHDHGDHLHALTYNSEHQHHSVSGMISNITPSHTHLISPTMGKIKVKIVHSISGLNHYHFDDIHNHGVHEDLHNLSTPTYQVSSPHEGNLNYNF